MPDGFPVHGKKLQGQKSKRKNRSTGHEHDRRDVQIHRHFKKHRQAGEQRAEKTENYFNFFVR